MSLQFLPLLLFGLPIAISDLRSRIIPNKLLLAMFFSSLLLRFLWDPHHLSLAFSVSAGTTLFAGVLWLISRKRIGMGDLKLMIVSAFILADFSRSLYAWMLALIFGLATFLVMRKREIPFAPALLLATFFAL